MAAISVGELEATLRLKDLMSEDLKAAEKNLRDAGVSVKQVSTDAGQAVKQMGDQVQAATGQVQAAAAPLKQASAAVRDVGAQARSAVPPVADLARAAMNLESLESISGAGLGKFAQSISAIGLSFSDLERMKPEERFRAVTDALASITSQSGAAAPAIQNVAKEVIGLGDAAAAGGAADAALASSLTLVVGVAAAAGAAILAIAAAAYALASSTAEAGGHLKDLSDKTSASVPALDALGHALHVAGGDIGTATNAMFDFEKRLQDTPDKIAQALGKIGLSVSDIEQLSPDRQFTAMAQAIALVQDPAERASAAVRLFGEQGRDLIPVFEKLTQAMELTAGIQVFSEQEASNAREFQIQVAALKESFGNLSKSLGNEIIPLVTGAIKFFREWGDEIRNVAAAIGSVLMPQLLLLKGTVVLVEEAIKSAFGLKVFSIFADGLGFILALFDKLRGAGVDLPKIGIDPAVIDEAKKKLKELSDATADAARSPDNLVAAWKKALADMQASAPVAGSAALKTIMKDLADQFAANERAAKAAAKAQAEWAAIMADLNSVGGNWAQTLDTIDGNVVEAVKFYLEAGVSQEKLAKAYGLTAEQVKAVAAEMEDHADTTKIMASIEKDFFTESLKISKQWAAETAKALKSVHEIQIDNMKDEIRLQKEHDDFLAEGTMNRVQLQLRAIDTWEKDEKAKLAARTLNWAEAERNIAAIEQAAADRRSKLSGIVSVATTDETETLIEEALAAQESARKLNVLSDALGGVANVFAQLSQIGGQDAFGQVAKSIGTVTVALRGMTKAMADVMENGWNTQSIIEVGTSFLTVAYAIYQIYDAIGKADAAANKLKDLAEWDRRIRGFVGTTLNVSETLRDSIKKTAAELAQLYRANGIAASDAGPAFLATALHLVDVLKDLGGVAALDAQQVGFVGESINALFDIIKDGTFSGATAAKALDQLDQTLVLLGQNAEDTNGLVSQLFLDSIKHAKDLGITLKETNKFVLEQLSVAATGLTSVVGGLAASASASLARTLGLMQDHIKTDFKLTARQAFVYGQIIGENLSAGVALTEGQIKKLLDAIDKGLITGVTLTQTEATGMAAAVAAAFGEMLSRGKTLKDALSELGPTIELLRKELDESGQDGGAAFARIAEMARIAADPILGPLLDSILGVGQALKGLHNSGLLTQEMFDGLTDSAVDAFNKLLAGGADAGSALQAIQPTLQTIWELQKKFGLQVDASTQALLDQAVAQGIVGEQFESDQDKMIDALDRTNDLLLSIAKVLGADIPEAAETGLGKVKGSIDKLPDKITIPIDFPETPIPVPNLPDGIQTFSKGGKVLSFMPRRMPSVSAGVGEVAHLARGGTLVPFQPRGTDTVPAMLTPGEQVLTADQYQNLVSGQGGQQVTIDMRGSIVLDGPSFEHFVDEKIMTRFPNAVLRDIAGMRRSIKRAAA